MVYGAARVCKGINLRGREAYATVPNTTTSTSTVLAQPIITEKKLSQQFFSRLDFFPVIQEKNQTRKTNGPVTPKIFSASWRRRAEYSPVSMTSAEDARFSALRFHPASDPRSG